MILNSAVRTVIIVYRRAVSPMLGRHCRFSPTCSEYTLRAVEMHGVGKGLWLGLKRIMRCNPLFRGGDDPVPPAIGGTRVPR